MLARIGPGAEHSLLFSGEQNKTNRAARNRARRLDDAGGVDHQGSVAAVVERARAKFPGIEMSAEDDELVGFFAASNFGDDIFGINRPGNFVRQFEMNADFLAGGDEAGHAFGIFTREDGLGQSLVSAGDGNMVVIEKKM